MVRDEPDVDVLSIDELRAEIARLCRQLTQADARLAELEAHAVVDLLLGILNRRGFKRKLRRSLAYVQRYGASTVLMFVDLDGPSMTRTAMVPAMICSRPWRRRSSTKRAPRMCWDGWAATSSSCCWGISGWRRPWSGRVISKIALPR